MIRSLGISIFHLTYGQIKPMEKLKAQDFDSKYTILNDKPRINSDTGKVQWIDDCWKINKSR